MRVPKVEDEARLGADAVLDGGLRVEGDAHGAALAAVSHARRVSQRGDGDDLAGAAVLPRPGHLKSKYGLCVHSNTAPRPRGLSHHLLYDMNERATTTRTFPRGDIWLM